MLVKASYFPNWKASGADGPYRVAPNLMVVVPTAEHVELSYGRHPVEWVGYALTLVGIALAIFLATRPPVPGPARPAPDGEAAPRRPRGAVDAAADRAGRPGRPATSTGSPLRPPTMTGRFRRLALVALVPTAVDVGLLVALRQGAGWILVLADLTAIAVASVVSYFLHRAYTFRSNPYVRWVQMPTAFIGVARSPPSSTSSCCGACTRPVGSTRRRR